LRDVRELSGGGAFLMAAPAGDRDQVGSVMGL
jgi:hypothetical protein